MNTDAIPGLQDGTDFERIWIYFIPNSHHNLPEFYGIWDLSLVSARSLLSSNQWDHQPADLAELVLSELPYLLAVMPIPHGKGSGTSGHQWALKGLWQFKPAANLL